MPTTPNTAAASKPNGEQSGDSSKEQDAIVERCFQALKLVLDQRHRLARDNHSKLAKSKLEKANLVKENELLRKEKAAQTKVVDEQKRALEQAAKQEKAALAQEVESLQKQLTEARRDLEKQRVEVDEVKKALNAERRDAAQKLKDLESEYKREEAVLKKRSLEEFDSKLAEEKVKFKKAAFDVVQQIKAQMEAEVAAKYGGSDNKDNAAK